MLQVAQFHTSAAKSSPTASSNLFRWNRRTFLLIVTLWVCLIAGLKCEESRTTGGWATRSRSHIEEILLESSKTKDEAEHEIVSERILAQLKDIYHRKIRPVEKQFHYADLGRRHVMTDADIHAKPFCLLVGPWSTGKSTMINYLTGTEGSLHSLYTGAEPTTSDFTVLSYGPEYKTIEGIVMATDSNKPFSATEKFGQHFLERLMGIEMPNKILSRLSFIDTPGILENRKQQERGYPYNDVMRWMVNRADLIFVVFDPTKLDIGIELESLFETLKGKESQLRIILNKADSIPEQELMRVYGALFWSLAPLINVTEPPRVYTGSFWSQQFNYKANEDLFLREEMTLLNDMSDVIRNRVQNKIAFIRQHAIRVRIHALLIDSYVGAYRRNKGMFGGSDALADEIVTNPDQYKVYKTILAHPNVSEYDLPHPSEYENFFNIHPLTDLHRISDFCGYLSGCALDKLDQVIASDLPKMLQRYQESGATVEETDEPTAADESECAKGAECSKESKPGKAKYQLSTPSDKPSRTARYRKKKAAAPEPEAKPEAIEKTEEELPQSKAKQPEKGKKILAHAKTSEPTPTPKQQKKTSASFQSDEEQSRGEGQFSQMLGKALQFIKSKLAKGEGKSDGSKEKLTKPKAAKQSEKAKIPLKTGIVGKSAGKPLTDSKDEVELTAKQKYRLAVPKVIVEKPLKDASAEAEEAKGIFARIFGTQIKLGDPTPKITAKQKYRLAVPKAFEAKPEVEGTTADGLFAKLKQTIEGFLSKNVRSTAATGDGDSSAPKAPATPTPKLKQQEKKQETVNAKKNQPPLDTTKSQAKAKPERKTQEPLEQPKEAQQPQKEAEKPSPAAPQSKLSQKEEKSKPAKPKMPAKRNADEQPNLKDSKQQTNDKPPSPLTSFFAKIFSFSDSGSKPSARERYRKNRTDLPPDFWEKLAEKKAAEAEKHKHVKDKPSTFATLSGFIFGAHDPQGKPPISAREKYRKVRTDLPPDFWEKLAEKKAQEAKNEAENPSFLTKLTSIFTGSSKTSHSPEKITAREKYRKQRTDLPADFWEKFEERKAEEARLAANRPSFLTGFANLLRASDSSGKTGEAETLTAKQRYRKNRTDLPPEFWEKLAERKAEEARKAAENPSLLTRLRNIFSGTTSPQAAKPQSQQSAKEKYRKPRKDLPADFWEKLEETKKAKAKAAAEHPSFVSTIISHFSGVKEGITARERYRKNRTDMPPEFWAKWEERKQAEANNPSILTKLTNFFHIGSAQGDQEPKEKPQTARERYRKRREDLPPDFWENLEKRKAQAQKETASKPSMFETIGNLFKAAPEIGVQTAREKYRKRRTDLPPEFWEKYEREKQESANQPGMMKRLSSFIPFLGSNIPSSKSAEVPARCKYRKNAKGCGGDDERKEEKEEKPKEKSKKTKETQPKAESPHKQPAKQEAPVKEEAKVKPTSTVQPAKLAPKQPSPTSKPQEPKTAKFKPKQESPKLIDKEPKKKPDIEDIEEPKQAQEAQPEGPTAAPLEEKALEEEAATISAPTTANKSASELKDKPRHILRRLFAAIVLSAAEPNRPCNPWHKSCRKAQGLPRLHRMGEHSKPKKPCRPRPNPQSGSNLPSQQQQSKNKQSKKPR